MTADSTSPTPPVDTRDSRAVLRYLIALWESQDLTEEVSFLSERVQAGLAVWALTSHAVECGRAVLTLYNAKQPITAAPVVRLLLEDAVTAGWLVVYPQNFRALVKKGVDERWKLFKELMARDGFADWAAGVHEDALALADELRDAGGFVLEQRMKELAGTDGLYSHYRLLTRLSHAGTGVVDLYLMTDDRSPAGVGLRTFGALPEAGGTIGIAAAMLNAALIAWDCSRVQRRWETELTTLAERMGVSTEWRPADGNK